MRQRAWPPRGRPISQICGIAEAMPRYETGLLCCRQGHEEADSAYERNPAPERTATGLKDIKKDMKL
jgi:hypothetical protein